jgi:nucleoside-diphosphate-sugar epimerase
LPVARGLRQPVHADDLAQAVLAALDCPAAAGRVLAIGGGERLTAGSMFARGGGCLARAWLPVPLPAWLRRCGRYAVARWRGPLTRLDTDLVADNDEMQRLLGIQPRGFAPDAAAWSPVA